MLVLNIFSAAFVAVKTVSVAFIPKVQSLVMRSTIETAYEAQFFTKVPNNALSIPLEMIVHTHPMRHFSCYIHQRASFYSRSGCHTHIMYCFFMVLCNAPFKFVTHNV